MRRPTLAFLFTLACATRPQPVPTFETALWPGEGRPVIESVASSLDLRREPSASSESAGTLRVTPGQRLQFDETRYRTIRPGRIVALTDSTVSGRRLGAVRMLSREDYYSDRFERGTVAVPAGTGFELLQYRAEGTCFVRIGGTVIDADTCPIDSRRFRVESQPAVEWWIRVVRDGKPMGWLLLSDATAKVVRREF